jgi:hypothetical protein
MEVLKYTGLAVGLALPLLLIVWYILRIRNFVAPHVLVTLPPGGDLVKSTTWFTGDSLKFCQPGQSMRLEGVCRSFLGVRSNISATVTVGVGAHAETPGEEFTVDYGLGPTAYSSGPLVTALHRVTLTISVPTTVSKGRYVCEWTVIFPCVLGVDVRPDAKPSVHSTRHPGFMSGE